MSEKVSHSSSPGVEKLLYIKDLKPNDEIRSSFLVQSKQIMTAKNGRPYLSLVLMDNSGTIDTRVWHDAEEMDGRVSQGDVVAVGGKTHIFQNRMQLIVQHMVSMPKDLVDPANYLPAAEINTEALYEKLLAVFETVENPWVKQLGLALLQDPEIAARYKVCPAAKTVHHAFIGGLLAHSYHLTRLVDAVVPLYEKVDRSLLIFGAVFHDFGKIYELSYEGPFGYTDEGKLVGHITIGVTLVDRKIQGIEGFPKDLEWQLKHLILTHHGRLEYGSPKRPATLEAQILHSLDDMDSKINSIQTLLESNGSAEPRWTSYHRLYDQYYFRGGLYQNSEPSPSSIQ